MNAQYNSVNIIYINTILFNTILLMITMMQTESEAVGLIKKFSNQSDLVKLGF